MSSEAPRQQADSDGQEPAQDSGDQQAQQPAPQRVSRRAWLALAGVFGLSMAGISTYEPPVDTQNDTDQEPSPSDLYILSEDRNKRIDEITAAFGRRIVDYAQKNRDNPERTTTFTPDQNYGLRGSGELRHGYSNPGNDRGFILKASVIRQSDEVFTYDQGDPGVGVLMEGPYDDDNAPTRNVDYSVFRGLPDQAKGTWVVGSSVAYPNSAPFEESSDFMRANSLTPDQLREIEDKTSEMFGQLLRQGGVPE